MGSPSKADCPAACDGNPINAAVGNKYQPETDFVAAAHTELELRRFYNSQDTTASAFGANWHSTWHRGLTPSTDTAGNRLITLTQADGRQLLFTEANGAWVADPDVTEVLGAVLDASNGQTGWTLVNADDSTEAYALDGRLLSVTTRAGLVTTLGYDANNRLTTVTGPFGHVLSFALDANNRVSQATTPAGEIFGYGYDGSGNLTSVTYPDARVRQYLYENTSFPHSLTGVIDENGQRFATWDYDANGWAISSQHAGGAELTTISYQPDGSASVTDALGNVHGYAFTTQYSLTKPTAVTGTPVQTAGGKAFTYDTNGFLASRTDFNGNLTTYTHDTRGLETSRTEASGTSLARTIDTQWHASLRLPTQITEPNRVTNFGYDAKGNLTQRTITGGGVTRTWLYTYNANGQVTRIDGPRTDVSDITQLSYDARGNLATITNALGHVTRITAYDANGRPLTIQDPNGLITQLGYDPRGRLRSRTVGGETSAYNYDAAGQLQRITKPDASFTAFIYDQAHRLTQVSDNLSNKIVYTLDAAGNRVKEEVYDPANALVRTLTQTFDALGRPNTATGAQGQTSTLGYDDNGNLTAAADPLGQATTRGYDALNRLIASTDPTSHTTQYQFDANDNLTRVTDPRGLATSYQFDGLGNPTATLSPDTTTTQNGFDSAGNPIRKTDANGNAVTYGYDALNRVTQISYPNSSPIVFTYDQGTNGIGRLTQMTDATGSTQWGYDAQGRVTSKTQRIGALSLTVRSVYDTSGRLTSVVYPSGKTLSLQYAQGQLTQTGANGATLLSNIQYRPFGAARSWTWGNGTAYSRGFDSDGRLIQYDLGGHTRQLSYDAAGRIQGYTDSPPLPGVGPLGLNETYNYAQTSNRILSLSGAYAKTYTYDQTGNIVNDGVNQFSYDGRNRLAQVTTPQGVEHYAINGLGQRVAKGDLSGNLTAPVYFVYDEAGHLLGEYDSSGAAVTETVWLGDTPVAVLKPGAPGNFFVYADHLSAPRAIAEASTGKIVWRWESEPFGSNAADEDPDKDGTRFAYNLRFPGQYYDQESGLHYNYYRDYDPRAGRYIQSDPVGLDGGINSYDYAGGNPSNAIDPGGLDWVIAMYDSTSGNPFGHLGIGPFVPNSSVHTIGFYPMNPSSTSDVILGKSVHGVMKYDTGMAALNSQIVVQTSGLQDLLIASYLQAVIASSPDYNLYGNNCSQTVAKALRAGGLDVPSGVIAPFDVIYWLQLHQRYSFVPKAPTFSPSLLRSTR